jgi:hypothetical protein
MPESTPSKTIPNFLSLSLENLNQLRMYAVETDDLELLHHLEEEAQIRDRNSDDTEASAYYLADEIRRNINDLDGYYG